MKLTPKEEANMVSYIALYYNCDTSCLNEIGAIVKKYGSTDPKTVYRGQSKKDTTIDNRKSFVSTSPDKEMADAFVEREWEPERKVGNLFTIHLENTKWLSTRSIEFTLDDKVKEELKKIIGTNLIEKDRNYTLDEFFPRIKPLVEELVADGEEILVSTDGAFYNDVSKKAKGFNPIGENEFETWRGGRKKSKMITMRKKDYLREHHHLLKVLGHPTKKKLLSELMIQRKELKERGLKGGTRRQSPRRSRSTYTLKV
jgi:hypothetical protein